MSTFWISLAVTTAGIFLALRWGAPVWVGYAAATFVLPHVMIGDVFHWRHFPQINSKMKVLWIFLAALGFVIFLVLRQAGDYAWPLFYIYFFGHFWKDLDMGMGRMQGGASMSGCQAPKRWCGGFLFIAFIVLSSGLIKDPFTVHLARRIAWAAAIVIFVFWIRAFRRARVSPKPLETAWARYLCFTVFFLLVCTWYNALRPDWRVLPNAIVVWHFVQWYVFYWWETKKETRQKHVLRNLTVLIVVINIFSVAGAVAYAAVPNFNWLKYIYQFPYLAGCWTVMHVTWDWVPKRVKHVQISI